MITSDCIQDSCLWVQSAAGINYFFHYLACNVRIRVKSKYSVKLKINKNHLCLFIILFKVQQITLKFTFIAFYSTCFNRNYRISTEINNSDRRCLNYKSLPQLFTVTGTCYIRVLWIILWFKYKDFNLFLFLFIIEISISVIQVIKVIKEN